MHNVRHADGVVGTATTPRPLGIEILGGDLFEVSLTSLLYLAQFEALTGWLLVGTRGVITLHKGQPGLICALSLRGADALRELLFHRGGRFSLIRGTPETSEDGLTNLTAVMMDAYRLRDEWTRLSPLVLRPAGAWQPEGPLAAVVERLDGRRSLAEAVRELEAPLTPMLDPLLQALARGLLVRIGGARPAAPVEASDDFFGLLDRARELTRRGELEAACAALRRALNLRPDDRVAQQNLRTLEQRLRQP